MVQITVRIPSGWWQQQWTGEVELVLSSVRPRKIHAWRWCRFCVMSLVQPCHLTRRSSSPTIRLLGLAGKPVDAGSWLGPQSTLLMLLHERGIQPRGNDDVGQS